MPLEDFYTSAIALDLSHVELKAAISVGEMEEALAKSGEEIERAEMPLEDFYTSAIALDLSHVELKAAISVGEMEEALAKSGEEIREG